MNSKSHFVFELGCEELPSSSLQQLNKSLRISIEEQLNLVGITYESISMIAAPRRLGFQIIELSKTSKERIFQRRGPSVEAAYSNGKPTSALIGFCKGLGISTDQVSIVKEKKGAWVAFSKVEMGSPTESLIGELCIAAVLSLSHQKSMRWGSGKEDFPRPVKWILAMLDSNVVDLTLFSKQSKNVTFGHRFHAPEQIKIDSASEYFPKLRKNFVIANFENRKKLVWRQIQSVAEVNDVAVEEDESLLDDICSLVEWPVGLAGKFETKFLSIPDIALIAAMRGHQKYFHTREKSGKLSNIFITVSNIESQNPNRVVKGNQTVVRARLSDAKYFFDSDRKVRLEELRHHLDSITFHPQLGSLGDKTCRIGILASEISSHLGLDPALTARAVELSRCDLSTEMVSEFDELQGLIGRLYAELDGEDFEVANAIGGLYQPAGTSDLVPADLLGSLLGLCDRIDTICGLFAIGQPPTGSKDPFGLRRAAIGLLRINEHNGLKLNLLPIIKRSVALQPINQITASEAVIQFIKDRERVRLIDLGLPHDVVAAVQETKGLANAQNVSRAISLTDFRTHPAFNSLVAANKRVANILAKHNYRKSRDVKSNLFSCDSENELWIATSNLRPQIDYCVSRETFSDALELLAGMHPTINKFFETVIVDDPVPSVKKNRLALLQETLDLFLTIADFKHIQT